MLLTLKKLFGAIPVINKRYVFKRNEFVSHWYWGARPEDNKNGLNIKAGAIAYLVPVHTYTISNWKPFLLSFRDALRYKATVISVSTPVAENTWGMEPAPGFLFRALEFVNGYLGIFEMRNALDK